MSQPLIVDKISENRPLCDLNRAIKTPIKTPDSHFPPYRGTHKVGFAPRQESGTPQSRPDSGRTRLSRDLGTPRGHEKNQGRSPLTQTGTIIESHTHIFLFLILTSPLNFSEGVGVSNFSLGFRYPISVCLWYRFGLCEVLYINERKGI